MQRGTLERQPTPLHPMATTGRMLAKLLRDHGAEERMHPEGDVILMESPQARDIIYVVSGTVEMKGVSHTHHRLPVTLEIIPEGRFLNTWAALEMPEPAANVSKAYFAATPVATLTLAAATVLAHPRLQSAIAKTLHARTVALHTRAIERECDLSALDREMDGVHNELAAKNRALRELEENYAALAQRLAEMKRENEATERARTDALSLAQTRILALSVAPGTPERTVERCRQIITDLSAQLTQATPQPSDGPATLVVAPPMTFQRKKTTSIPPPLFPPAPANPIPPAEETLKSAVDLDLPPDFDFD